MLQLKFEQIGISKDVAAAAELPSFHVIYDSSFNTGP
jgi:hypothetical protein